MSWYVKQRTSTKMYKTKQKQWGQGFWKGERVPDRFGKLQPGKHKIFWLVQHFSPLLSFLKKEVVLYFTFLRDLNTFFVFITTLKWVQKNALVHFKAVLLQSCDFSSHTTWVIFIKRRRAYKWIQTHKSSPGQESSDLKTNQMYIIRSRQRRHCVTKGRQPK